MDQRNFHRLLTRTFALPFLLMALLAATLLWLNQRQGVSLNRVEHSDEIIRESRGLVRMMLDMETGLRGYLLTGERAFLEPYQQASAQIEGRFANLEGLVAKDPFQAQRVQQIHAAYNQWAGYAQEMVRAREAGGDYQSAAVNLRGKTLMDKTRRLRDELVAVEDSLRAGHMRVARRDARAFLAAVIALTLLLAALLASITRRQMLHISDTYRKAREELDAVLSSMAEGLYQLDTEGRLVYLNPAGERLLGYRLEEIRGRNMHDVVHSRTPDGHGRSWEECPLLGMIKKGADYYALEDYLVRKDGSFLPVESAGSPIVLKGRVIGAVLSFRDLSERKRSEEALRASEKLATAGRLAATLAHEIHNPMDSIGNLLYMLGALPLDQPALHYVSLAREEMARVVQITRHMLGLHREAASPVPVKLTEILDGVLAFYERRIAAENIRVEKRYDSEGEVHAFPGEMRQVFSNLVTNAIEALEPGGTIRLHVFRSCDWSNAGRGGARVVIADDGGGISAEHRRKLFQPFFTTKAEKGTGLGLWVSQGIVQKHDGFIRVRSRTRPPRRGTIFSVFLPG